MEIQKSIRVIYLNKDPIHQDDQQTFLENINVKGIFLEDKAYLILKNHYPQSLIKRNMIIEEHRDFKSEIDLFFDFTNSPDAVNNKLLFIECKRTKKTWIFTKIKEDQNSVNLMYHEPRYYYIKKRSLSPHDFISVRNQIAIKFENDGRLKICNKKEIENSYESIRKAIKQILNGIQAFSITYLNSYVGDNKGVYQLYPVIVTNAPLYIIEYSINDIDEDGNLKEYKAPKPVDSLVYNFPKVVFHSKDNAFFLNPKQPGRQDHIKSVFIININALQPELSKVIDQNL